MDKINYSPVAINRCDKYEEESLVSFIKKQFAAAGIDKNTIFGKNVVIKPNLVTARGPEMAATTHPMLLKAVVRVLRDYSPSSIILAESPGGPYNEVSLRHIYKVCGISEAAADISLTLNTDTSAENVSYGGGVRCRVFHMITPIVNADVIVNLCKLKTHSLMKMSCAVKNYFGVIPGIEKFEMHAAYSNVNDFAEMIVDLCACLYEKKTLITVCDGILAMEGNGPSSGIPRKMNLLMTSLSPFSIDAIAEEIIGYSGQVLTNKVARTRNLAPSDLSEIEIIGDSINDFAVSDFLEPDSSSGKFLKELPNIFGGRLAKYFEPRPLVNNKKCVGCGRCADSCPVHTISMIEINGKRKAKINKDRCIRCYCCQELCPIDAVDTKKNFLIKIIK